MLQSRSSNGGLTHRTHPWGRSSYDAIVQEKNRGMGGVQVLKYGIGESRKKFWSFACVNEKQNRLMKMSRKMRCRSRNDTGLEDFDTHRTAMHTFEGKISWEVELDSQQHASEYRKRKEILDRRETYRSGIGKEALKGLMEESGLVGSRGFWQRRELLLASVCFVSSLLSSSVIVADAHADNTAVTTSLNKYIKKKKLDRIDTYIPPLLNARSQLIRTGRVMLQDPKEARALLRSGAFSGLRDSVRSVGEYMAQDSTGSSNADSGKSLSIAFTRSLESFDQSLMMAVREGKSVAEEDSRTKLEETIAALDALIRALPEEDVKRAQKVVDDIDASNPIDASSDTEEVEKLRMLIQ